MITRYSEHPALRDVFFMCLCLPYLMTSQPFDEFFLPFLGIEAHRVTVF